MVSRRLGVSLLTIVLCCALACNKRWEYQTRQLLRGTDEAPMALSVPWPDVYANQGLSNRLGPNLFYMAVPAIELLGARQDTDSLCWAAAIQTALAYRGIATTQCEILRKLGHDCRDADDHFASRSDMVTALDGSLFPTQRGLAYVRATSLRRQDYGASMLFDMSQRRPVVVALRSRTRTSGHVYVLTGVKYAWHPGSSTPLPLFHEVKLYDPSPDVDDVVTMDGSEFRQLFEFGLQIVVALP